MKGVCGNDGNVLYHDSVCVCVCVCARARVCARVCVCVSRSVISDSLRPMDCSQPGLSVHGIL